MLLAAPSYTASRFAYQRRKSREVQIGNVGVGGTQPIRVQSMTTTRTQDVEATLAQSIRLVESGCEIVRITAPTVTDAQAIGEIKRRLRARGIDVPLVADIHFSPAAAMEAAEHVEKVRVNPGNFADQKFFRVREYTDADYAAEIQRIEERFTPLVVKCKERGVAMRIGSNHGSLSDRIMNRYGDTPAGMVESALEFVRIARKHHYHEIVLSMKASNPKIMIQAYRLLVARMDEEGLDPYPLHLGVTEAGLGEDGRIKSAIGIGALLDDGLGDTIRVSLTEEPEAEVPVAQRLVAPYNAGLTAARVLPDSSERVDPYSYSRRLSRSVSVTSTTPDAGLTVGNGATVAILDPPEEALSASAAAGTARIAVDLSDLATLEAAVPWYDAVRTYRALASRAGDTPLHLQVAVDGDELDVLLRASTVLGSLLCDGLGDSVGLTAPGAPEDMTRLLFGILQAAGVRITRTEFVSCPSCGRTLFDLQSTTERIASRTSHLKGVKIAIMGCVVNGPGEMADADFGYVGGSPGKVNLYVGKDVVEKAVPEEEADQRLVDLIKQHGKWVEAKT
ncbi:MAG TPA: (E)-4-hydroxy-3-methylbut-2-enyl-diphosphate synthase [Chloroflexota bacterium]|nr:(E)-4-hydroxy-3-methylbut-2-enyl-diphosphate synthase [Chloroflexota bacterium]